MRGRGPSQRFVKPGDEFVRRARYGRLCSGHDRCWPEADLPQCLLFGRCRGKSGPAVLALKVRDLLPPFHRKPAQQANRPVYEDQINNCPGFAPETREQSATKRGERDIWMLVLL